MALRRENRNVLLGFVGLLILAVILLVVLLTSFGGSGNPVPAQPSEAAPSPTVSVTPVPSEASSSPAVTSPPAIAPLPQGNDAPVATPGGTTPNGWTAGAMIYPVDAPDFTVKVYTPVLKPHWGFTYNFQCGPNLDDPWRQSHPGHGSFSVRLGDSYLIRGTAYNGSGQITIRSNSTAAHALVVSGPCTYGMNYYEYPN